eukprot:1035202-Prymnesium_polylepis.1
MSCAVGAIDAIDAARRALALLRRLILRAALGHARRAARIRQARRAEASRSLDVARGPQHGRRRRACASDLGHGAVLDALPEAREPLAPRLLLRRRPQRRCRDRRDARRPRARHCRRGARGQR